MVAQRKAPGFFSGNLSGFYPEKRSNGTRSQLRQGAALGDWGPPQQAILQSKNAECVPLCIACQFCSS